MISRSSDNGAYAWSVSNVVRVHNVNGLNQYTAAGPATFGYDANGNLEMPSFNDGRGIIAVYFRGVAEAAELVINVEALQAITRLKASVVIW